MVDTRVPLPVVTDAELMVWRLRRWAGDHAVTAL